MDQGDGACGNARWHVVEARNTLFGVGRYRRRAAAGSCACVTDHLAEGKTRIHGYFFCPVDGVAYFDLNDVIADLLRRGERLLLIHGDQDVGCLESTRQSVQEVAGELERPLSLAVLENHGHMMSDAIKQRITDFIARPLASHQPLD